MYKYLQALKRADVPSSNPGIVYLVLEETSAVQSQCTINHGECFNQGSATKLDSVLELLQKYDQGKDAYFTAWTLFSRVDFGWKVRSFIFPEGCKSLGIEKTKPEAEDSGWLNSTILKIHINLITCLDSISRK